MLRYYSDANKNNKHLKLPYDNNLSRALVCNFYPIHCHQTISNSLHYMLIDATVILITEVYVYTHRTLPRLTPMAPLVCLLLSQITFSS